MTRWPDELSTGFSFEDPSCSFCSWSLFWSSEVVVRVFPLAPLTRQAVPSTGFVTIFLEIWAPPAYSSHPSWKNRILRTRQNSKEDEERKKQKEKNRIDNNNFGKRKRTKRNRQKEMQKKITSMLKENGETTNEREEILSICSDFYKKLYAKPQDLVEKSPEQEKVPKFTDKEIEDTLKSLKKEKAPGIDNNTSDILKLGGKEVIKAFKTIFNEILESQEIPETWREAKVIILHKKGERTDIKNYRPVSLLSHTYKLFTRAIQNGESARRKSTPRTGRI